MIFILSGIRKSSDTCPPGYLRLNRLILTHYLQSTYGWLYSLFCSFAFWLFGHSNMIPAITHTQTFLTFILKEKYLKYSPFLSTAPIVFTIFPHLFIPFPYTFFISCLSFGKLFIPLPFWSASVLDRQAMLLWIPHGNFFFIFRR